MKKRLLALLFSVLCLFALCACGKDADVDVPEGMQICAGGDDLGYWFFVPSEWQKSNLGSVSAAFASPLDSSSVSLGVGVLGDAETIPAYFARTIADLPMPVTMVVDGESAYLGNIPDARMFVYDTVYAEHPFRFMCVIGEYSDTLYIFTYGASTEERSDGKNFYEYWLDRASAVRENILFIGAPKEKEPLTFFGEPDADGYRVASDASLCGFSLYVPAAFTPTVQSGLTEARAADGATVSMAQATGTGVSVKEYFEIRKEELSALVGTVTVLAENRVIDFAGAKDACEYEYTFSFGGRDYHVLQVLLVHGQAGYVFTYTAPESAYAAHLPEVEKMMQKVVF